MTFLKRWTWIGKYLFTAIVLWVVYTRLNLQQFGELFASINWTWWIVAWLGYCVTQALCTRRWQILLQAMASRVAYLRLLGLYWVGMFFNLFFPSFIGGDVWRVVDLHRQTRRGHEAAISVLADRYSGLVAMGILALVASFGLIPLWHQLPMKSLLFAMIVLFLAGICLLYARVRQLVATALRVVPSQRLHDLWDRFSEALANLQRTPNALRDVLILSLVVQWVNILVYQWLAYALGARLPFYYFYILVPVITILSMLPVTIGGAGVREALCLILLVPLGMTRVQAVGLGLLWFSVHCTLGLVGGLVFLFQRRTLPQPEAAPAPATEPVAVTTPAPAELT